MEKFNVATIVYATGCTEGQLSGWASARNISTKGGLDIQQIVEFIKAPKKSRTSGGVDEKAAARLRTALEVLGAIPQSFTLEG